MPSSTVGAGLVAVPLIAGLPAVIIGVPLGLVLGGTASTIVTWFSTEGQVGLAWLIAGAFLLRGRRGAGERVGAARISG